jgi:tRNA nucleotidyltransferase (CCA-adding enzyme)
MTNLNSPALPLAAPALEALRLLEAAGHEAWVVGGAVRDLLAGRPPQDWDIATSASPDMMRAAFGRRRVWEMGRGHGTLSVIIRGCPVEATVFRRGGDALGRGPATIADDLAARDFTLNAMAYHPERGVLDLAGGRADLQAGLIRAVGDPAARFGEDPLRVLRALRLAADDYRLEEETARVMRRWASRLSRVAPDRIWREFRLLLCGPAAPETLRRWPDAIGVFLPEMLAMVGFDQYNRYHAYDVYEHTLRALAFMPPRPDLRLAIFFHDIGKPATFTRDAAGAGHFYGHAALSAEIAARVMRRLHSSRAERELVCALVLRHDMEIACRRQSVRRCLHLMGPDLFRALLQVKRADNLAHHPDYIGFPADELERLAEEILAGGECLQRADLAVNGHDLLALGIPPGRALGRILDMLLQTVRNKRCANEKQALLGLVRELTL